jgi:hypothetical protein
MIHVGRLHGPALGSFAKTSFILGSFVSTTWALCAESRDRRQCAEYIVEVCGLWYCIGEGYWQRNWELTSASCHSSLLIDSFLY